MRGFRSWLAPAAVAVQVAALVPHTAAAAEEPPAPAAPPAGNSGAMDTGAGDTGPGLPAGGAERTLTLAEVERAAIEHQAQLAVARAATATAQAVVEQARSPLLPQVTAQATYTRETGNFAPRPGAIPGGAGASPPPSSLSRSFDFWNFGLSATQLIYDFGQTFGKYRAAEASADASQLSEQTTRLQVISLVRRSFFGVRAAKDLVTVARQTLESQNQHLAQVQGFVTVGTQPAIALAQQRAAVANAEVQLITAQNNYETAKVQLNVAIGVPEGTDYDVSDDELPPVEDEDQPSEALARRGLATRPELRSLEKQRVAEEETLRSAKGGYGPNLSAAAGLNAAGTTLDGLVPNWSAELLLTWLVFQGGLTNGQVHQAEAGLQSIDAQRAVEQLQVRMDIDTARLAVRAAKATIGATTDAVTSAKEQLRLAEQRYATGVGNIIELNDAQVAYTSAAAQAVQARFALSSARAQLLAALGRT